MNDRTVKLDVRDDIRNGREPFSRIMHAVAALRADEQLLLIAPIEPVPLFAVLQKQGFRHTAQLVESGDWKVLFARNCQNTSENGNRPPEEAEMKCGVEAAERGIVDRSLITSAGAPVEEVDARGLEPPQPMVTILEKLARLPVGVELRARTDRRPMHLYSHLEERGFVAETLAQSDGSYLTHIRRR